MERQDLEDELKALRDRVDDLERAHLCLRRRVLTPFFLPTRSQTKIAAGIALALTLLALIFAFTPQSLSIGGWRYESSGISMEAIASVGAAVGVFVTLREHLKDKSQYERPTKSSNDDFNL